MGRIGFEVAGLGDKVGAFRSRVGLGGLYMGNLLRQSTHPQSH